MNENTIHVRFVDAETGKVIAEINVPLPTLPQSFEAATHLELSGQHWDVVAADPVMAELFSRSGNLLLTLRRRHVTQVGAKEILYSLPTICDAIPAIAESTSKLNKRVFEFHEDDWRQIELISIDHQDAVQAELSDIQHIYLNTPVGSGFHTLHIRQRITTALNLPFSAVMAAFPNARSYEGIAYQQVAGLIDGGFGFETADFILFGEQHQVFVNTLCLALTQAKSYNGTSSNQLKALMASYELILVDWCRCAAFDAMALDGLWTR